MLIVKIEWDLNFALEQILIITTLFVWLVQNNERIKRKNLGDVALTLKSQHSSL